MSKLPKIGVIGGGTLVIPKGMKKRKNKERDPRIDATQISGEDWVLYTSLYRGGDVARIAIPLDKAYDFLTFNLGMVIAGLAIWLITLDTRE